MQTTKGISYEDKLSPGKNLDNWALMEGHEFWLITFFCLHSNDFHISISVGTVIFFLIHVFTLSLGGGCIKSPFNSNVCSN